MLNVANGHTYLNKLTTNAASIKGLMYWSYWYVILNASLFLILKAPNPRKWVRINISFFTLLCGTTKMFYEVPQRSIKIKNYVNFKDSFEIT